MNEGENERRIETIRYDAPIGYAEAYAEQLQLREQVARGDRANALMLLEHTPVFTLGRNAHEEHLLMSAETLAGLGIEVRHVDRGGDVTYHGPGQLVAYPILNLRLWRCSVSWYLRTLEDVLIDTLAAYGLRGERNKGFTGVWIDRAKVAAVGIGIRDWISYHGIALNVAPNMEHWQLIVPCGIPDKPVTSLDTLLGADCPAFADVSDEFHKQFLRTFQFSAFSDSRTEG